VTGMLYIDGAVNNSVCVENFVMFRELAANYGSLLGAIQVPWIIWVLGLMVVVEIILISIYLLFPLSTNDVRIAPDPEEIRDSVNEAREAISACVAMGKAVAFSDALTSAAAEGGLPEESLRWDGPSHDCLSTEAKREAFECLESCRKLAAEGLELTGDSRYVVMQAILRNAAAACENCPVSLGQQSCPAQELLEKMSIG